MKEITENHRHLQKTFLLIFTRSPCDQMQSLGINIFLIYIYTNV